MRSQGVRATRSEVSTPSVVRRPVCLAAQSMAPISAGSST